MRQRAGIYLLTSVGVAAGCLKLDRRAIPNNVPTASAEAPAQIEGGEQVTMRATGFDADGAPLTFTWSQLGGSPVELSSHSDPEVTFRAPEQQQTLVFSLVASDGIDESVPSLVQIAVKFNRPPVANAGGPRSVPNLSSIALSGALSQDPDGDAITFDWTVEAGPAGADLAGRLTGANTKYPVFTPDKKGTYTLSLVVHDGKVASQADYAVITSENNPPDASAGEDVSILNTTATVLAGTASDIDGDTDFTWSWEVVVFPSGATFELIEPKSPTPTFAPHGKGGYIL